METYVHCLHARQQAVDRLEAMRGQIRLNQQEINQLLAAGCAASRLAQAHLYERALEKQQTDLILALTLAERRLQTAFQAMIAARQNRKMVENLRGKQQARHQREEWREEQKLLDDLASRRGRAILTWNSAEAAL